MIKNTKSWFTTSSTFIYLSKFAKETGESYKYMRDLYQKRKESPNTMETSFETYYESVQEAKEEMNNEYID